MFSLKYPSIEPRLADFRAFQDSHFNLKLAAINVSHCEGDAIPTSPDASQKDTTPSPKGQQKFHPILLPLFSFGDTAVRADADAREMEPSITSRVGASDKNSKGCQSCRSVIFSSSLPPRRALRRAAIPLATRLPVAQPSVQGLLPSPTEALPRARPSVPGLMCFIARQTRANAPDLTRAAPSRGAHHNTPNPVWPRPVRGFSCFHLTKRDCPCSRRS